MDNTWAESLRHFPDRYGRTWDMDPADRCPECGQPRGPLRCLGGKDHDKLPATDVIRLGGHFPEQHVTLEERLAFERAGRAEAEAAAWEAREALEGLHETTGRALKRVK